MVNRILNVLMVLIATSVLIIVSGCDQKSGAAKQESNPAQINVQDSVTKAQTALSSKNYGQAVESARLAVNAEPKNAKALFVMAEAQGANGDVFGALKSLDDALKNGYDNKNTIYASEYLEKTRASAGFSELMTKYGLAKTKTAKKATKGTTYQSEDTIRAGDVKINMKEVFKDEK
jgi:tetratricopeptide (TPR) repeat protein